MTPGWALCVLASTSSVSAAAPSPADCQPEVRVQGNLLRMCPDRGLWVEPTDGAGFWLKWTESASVTGLRRLEDGVLMVGSGPTSTPPSTPSAKPSPRAALTMRAVDQSRLLVRVDRGRDSGVYRGMPIAFAPSESGRGDEARVVGTVHRSESDHADVKVGLQERVPPGAVGRAVPTERATRPSIAAPRRPAGVAIFRARAGPFFNSGQQTLGLFAKADVAYHFRFPFALVGELDPLAITGRSRADSYLLAMAGRLFAEWDPWIGGVGLGVGAATLNDANRDLLFGDLGANDPTVVPTLSLRLRLGARDGLSLVGTGTVLVQDGLQTSDLGFVLGVPLSSDVLLRLAGQGGRTGYYGGEVELRILAQGNGGAGTVFASFTGAFGAVAYDERCAPEGCAFVNETVGGGSFAVGLEARL